MERYWIYREGFLRGPYPAGELVAQAGVTEKTLVCLEGEDAWRPLGDFADLSRSLAGRVVQSGDYRPAEPPAAEPPVADPPAGPVVSFMRFVAEHLATLPIVKK